MDLATGLNPPLAHNLSITPPPTNSFFTSPMLTLYDEPTAMDSSHSPMDIVVASI
ncbi:hypothetical protein U1Q18_043131, partial [Sarracenia purpurea var. burkii]